MSDKSIRPEDILPDGVDHTLLNGQQVRKGSVAAFLANIDIIESPTTTADQKNAAWQTMHELVPTLIAVGIHKHLKFRNEAIEKLFLLATTST